MLQGICWLENLYLGLFIFMITGMLAPSTALPTSDVYAEQISAYTDFEVGDRLAYLKESTSFEDSSYAGYEIVDIKIINEEAVIRVDVYPSSTLYNLFKHKTPLKNITPMGLVDFNRFQFPVIIPRDYSFERSQEEYNIDILNYYQRTYEIDEFLIESDFYGEGKCIKFNFTAGNLFNITGFAEYSLTGVLLSSSKTVHQFEEDEINVYKKEIISYKSNAPGVKREIYKNPVLWYIGIPVVIYVTGSVVYGKKFKKKGPNSSTASSSRSNLKD